MNATLKPQIDTLNTLKTILSWAKETAARVQAIEGDRFTPDSYGGCAAEYASECERAVRNAEVCLGCEEVHHNSVKLFACQARDYAVKAANTAAIGIGYATYASANPEDSAEEKADAESARYSAECEWQTPRLLDLFTAAALVEESH